MDQQAPTRTDPAQAFEALRAEVSLLRRGVEALTVERHAMPDYAPTLAQMSQHLEAIMGWARKVSERPAIRLTPTSLAEEITAASQQARAADHQAMQIAARDMVVQTRELTASLQGRIDLRRQLAWLAGAGAALLSIGLILGDGLGSTIDSIAPASWHWPEQRAADDLVMSGQDAGQHLLQVYDPVTWHALIEAGRLVQANAAAISACRAQAVSGKDAVSCSIIVSPPAT